MILMGEQKKKRRGDNERNDNGNDSAVRWTGSDLGKHKEITGILTCRWGYHNDMEVLVKIRGEMFR
jgi:hypothetical protein